jgi:anti-anti-sigma factor
MLLGQYEIVEPIQGGPDHGLYQGYRVEGGAPVVIKLPRSNPPTPRDLARLQHEYTLLRELDVPGVVKALALERQGTSVALILEAIPGRTLEALLAEGRLAPAAALRIAVAIAGILEGVHAQGVVHKDIKPASVVVHRDTSQACLIDFGLATRLSRETPRPVSPDALEGTLAYLSPEQTGRMNRTIDRRTDFYSFGVTLYQMLTGVLPFPGSDPVELVHSHIARVPASPREVDAAIPEALSAIVMKLMAKAPEDRYQSAYGVKADLLECLKLLDATGTALPFPLGLHDTDGSLRIPQKLYGRSAEERALLEAFERARAGSAELLLVSGYSGIGKSSLIHEIHRSIARGGGYFIAGKFDQRSRNVPYAPVTQAFRDLVRQILGERGDRLARWREDLERVLGANGQVLIDLLPELELILGPQPATVELGPAESQNRFNLLFSGFVRVFTGSGSPLVLFLDDLQWADPGSLKLLQILLTDPGRRRLLILGAYRDNEVGPAHPLQLTLEALRREGTALTEIQLLPLGVLDLRDLLVDALRAPSERAEALAQVVFRKTRGNPFFVTQLLLALHKERLLRFDAEVGAWAWDLDAIESSEVMGNVLDFMTAKIRLYGPATRRALELAACIGHEFDLRTLSIVHDLSPADTASALWEAVEDGLILPMNVDYRFLHGGRAPGGASPGADGPLDVSYRFLHDRVQQAAYSLIDDARKVEMHLRIGRLLLAGEPERGRDEVSFACVDHLDAGAAKITDPAERLELVRLNLAAGRKAKSATAYEAAAGYLDAGAALLPEDPWSAAYPLCFALQIERAECEYLCGRFEEAEETARLLLENARSTLDSVSVLILQMKLYQVAGTYDEGVVIGLRALKLFGITLPDTDAGVQAAIAFEAGEIQRSMAGRSIAGLLDAPLMTDPEQRAIMSIFVNVMPCAYIGRPKIFPLLGLLGVSLSLRHGNTEESCFAYSVYGFMLVAVFGDIPAGFQFSEMSLQLNERLADPRLKGTLLHLHGDHVNFWRRHIRTDFPILERGFQACLEVGDLVYAGFLAFLTVWQALERGDTLGEVRRLSERYATFARESKNEVVYQTIRMEQQLLSCLEGSTRGDTSLDDGSFDELSCLALMTQASFGTGVAFYHVTKLILLYTHGRYEEALISAVTAQGVIGAVMALPIEATYTFYHALALAARRSEPGSAQESADRALLQRHLARLSLWAENCPENFEHRALLVRAEVARIEGRPLEAEDLYDRAILSAEANEFPHYQALASELAGRFYEERGRALIAPVYLGAAHRGYTQWGALAKARRLVEKHPQLALALAAAEPGLSDRAEGPPSTAPQSQGLGAVVDVATVVRLGQALATEIELDRVLDQLMRIVLHNAGGRRGLLFLEQEGALHLAAEISVDPDLVRVGMKIPIEERPDLPLSVVQYVSRTREVVVVGDLGDDPRFAADLAVAGRRTRSVLCLALVHQRRLHGVLYLENDLAKDAFSPERVQLLEILCSHAVTALENAMLYRHVREVSAALQQSNERLEKDVAARTEDLRETNTKLVRELAERELAERARATLQEEVIRMQGVLLNELSTPLIPITDTIMVMPLIGTLDDRRAQLIMETVLDGAQENRARVVILDITGITGIDTAVAGALLGTARALRLLGAQAVLTGVSPAVAQTLVGLGVELGTLVTCGSLQSGIAYALQVTGDKAFARAGGR